MEDGQTITLSDGTGLAHFGIHAQDGPDDAQSFNSIKGGKENNTLFDTAGSDKIEGLGGDDIISVYHGGKDWVLGGAGADDVMVRVGMTDDVLIEGNGGADHMTSGGGDDYIYGSAAKDLLVGGLGSDLVSGGGGGDALFGDGNVVFLGPASWSIAVEGDVFSLTMEHGSEMIDEAGDGDALYGGAGNDFISNGFSLNGTSYN